MKKLLLSLFLGLSMIAVANSQTVTNVVTFTNEVTIVNTYGLNLVGVVSSLAPPLTGIPSWVTNYVYSSVYTNGITRTNSTVYCLWGEPPNQERGVYQGPFRPWNGKFYITLERAAVRVRPGQSIHMLIAGTMGSTLVNTNMTVSTNWSMYKIVDIPTNKPAWLP